MAAYTNIHARQWGRGIRPWLLLPKCFFVALLLGGLFALALLAAACTLANTAEQSQFAWVLLRTVFRYQVIPATIGAVVFGVLLLAQHRREFVRMRWMRVKLALVVIAAPSLHLWLSSGVISLSAANSSPGRLLPALTTALAFFALIAVLGRLKPRLWQCYGSVR